ncbi:hypothetical protein EYF80_006692 [Liparis tanakae]|uniref:Uncharacterized protein n=1 Tax=Liparis tanakae TaxID=230148 RepID=A0A4Z2IYL8_9TELE|nr:hypothetical protein EYF80_006692 [Liparis tanakae]
MQPGQQIHKQWACLVPTIPGLVKTVPFHLRVYQLRLSPGDPAVREPWRPPTPVATTNFSGSSTLWSHRLSPFQFPKDYQQQHISSTVVQSSSTPLRHQLFPGLSKQSPGHPNGHIQHGERILGSSYRDDSLPGPAGSSSTERKLNKAPLTRSPSAATTGSRPIAKR